MSKQSVLVMALSTLISLGLSGCRYDASGIPDPAPTQTRDRLATPQSLALVPAACFLEVNRRALPLTGGSIDVEASLTGQIQLDAADIRLGDVVVPATADVPEDLHFTDVRLSLPKPVSAKTEWSAAGDAGFTRVVTDVELHWSLVAEDGTVLPLAPQKIAKVPLVVDVFDASDGRLTAVVHGEIDGTFYQWVGILSMSDLTVDLRAEAQGD